MGRVIARKKRSGWELFSEIKKRACPLIRSFDALIFDWFWSHFLFETSHIWIKIVFSCLTLVCTLHFCKKLVKLLTHVFFPTCLSKIPTTYCAQYCRKKDNILRNYSQHLDEIIKIPI